MKKIISLTSGLILATLALAALERAQAQELVRSENAGSGSKNMTFLDAVEVELSGSAKEVVRAEMKENAILEQDLKDVRVNVDSEQKKITVSGEAPSVRHLIFAGIELGSLFPVAVEANYMNMRGSAPLWSVDVRIEPSSYLNSISVAGAYHPFESAFFVGARLRQLFLHNPFIEEYDSETESVRGIGLESGFKWRLDSKDTWLLSVSLGATKAISSVVDLPVMVNLNAGISIRVFELVK